MLLSNKGRKVKMKVFAFALALAMLSCSVSAATLDVTLTSQLSPREIKKASKLYAKAAALAASEGITVEEFLANAGAEEIYKPALIASAKLGGLIHSMPSGSDAEDRAPFIEQLKADTIPGLKYENAGPLSVCVELVMCATAAESICGEDTRVGARAVIDNGVCQFSCDNPLHTFKLRGIVKCP